jgi:hypothetical protein
VVAQESAARGQAPDAGENKVGGLVTDRICAVCHQPHPQDRPLDAAERVACFRSGYHRLEQEVERQRARAEAAERREQGRIRIDGVDALLHAEDRAEAAETELHYWRTRRTPAGCEEERLAEVARAAEAEARASRLEAALRDEIANHCDEHPDDCACRACSLVFRVALRGEEPATWKDETKVCTKCGTRFGWGSPWSMCSTCAEKP